MVGLEEKVDSFSQAAVERDCVGRVVPSRARYAHSASFRFSAFTSSSFAYNRLICRWLRVKDSPRKRVLKLFVIICRTACCVWRRGRGIFAPCLHPPRRCGEGHSAPPFLSCCRQSSAPVEVKAVAFKPKLLNEREMVSFRWKVKPSPAKCSFSEIYDRKVKRWRQKDENRLMRVTRARWGYACGWLQLHFR